MLTSITHHAFHVCLLKFAYHTFTHNVLRLLCRSIDRMHTNGCACREIPFRIRSTSAFSDCVNTCGLNQVPRTSYAIRIALSIAIERKRKWNVGGSSGMLRTDLCDLSVVFLRRRTRKLAVMPSRSWNADDGTRLLQADYAMPFSYFSFLSATRVKIYLLLV